MNGDSVPEAASIGESGIRVFYGISNLIPATYLGDASNMYLLSKTGTYSFPCVDLVRGLSTGIPANMVTVNPLASNGGTADEILVVLSRSPAEGVTNVSEINGTNGFKVIASPDEREVFYDVHRCQDMNNDGLNELSFYTIDDFMNRSVLVWYGCSNAIHGNWVEDQLDGTNGMKIRGGLKSPGTVVATADFNGDGRGDIAVNTASGLAIVWGRRRYDREICATNLAPEDGVVVRNAEVSENGGCGDINGDGIDDIFNNGTVMYGRTNWGLTPDAATMGLGGIMRPVLPPQVGISLDGNAIIGDLNGDGYDDWAVSADFLVSQIPYEATGAVVVVYGRPLYATTFPLWLPDGTNGFAIRGVEAVNEGRTSFFNTIESMTRGGDWNNDGYEEAVFGLPTPGFAPYTNHGGLVCITPGGPSPAWSPYLFSPLLVMEGHSNSFGSEELTNVVVGRKGKRHIVLADNGEPIEQDWLGTWFTTRVVRTATRGTAGEIVTVHYWTTNMLGPSTPPTTLVVTAIPEPAAWLAILALALMRLRI